jgi:hypothetical protein
MSVTGQAGNADSILCRFLDARLPQRDVVAQAWVRRVETAPWSGIETPSDYRKQLGSAIEIRIGLDLGTAPGYWDLLSFLPPDECRALLSSAGTVRMETSTSLTLGPQIHYCGSGPESATRSPTTMASEPP